ncbi:uncharacterized protein LOC117803497 [Ailuropoda melanoleuca]|uniref:uncharacterized protein LOC117803497 n=1 Tax=Ailuropoda melanoleuca TaxID=9646 RepID=UPI0014950104|nr:uncharacterized protein LOC117803497 [Ailuropoda melanoleuca]
MRAPPGRARGGGQDGLRGCRAGPPGKRRGPLPTERQAAAHALPPPSLGDLSSTTGRVDPWGLQPLWPTRRALRTNICTREPGLQEPPLCLSRFLFVPFPPASAPHFPEGLWLGVRTHQLPGRRLRDRDLTPRRKARTSGGKLALGALEQPESRREKPQAERVRGTGWSPTQPPPRGPRPSSPPPHLPLRVCRGPFKSGGPSSHSLDLLEPLPGVGDSECPRERRSHSSAPRS